MGYTQASKKASEKYIKEKQQSILLRIKKEDYDTKIKPAIDDSGLPVATYIKNAIFEKIERDSKSSSK